METPRVNFYKCPIKHIDGKRLIYLYLENGSVVKLPKKYIKGNKFSGGDEVSQGIDGFLTVCLKINNIEYYNFTPENYDEVKRIRESQEITVNVVEDMEIRYYIEGHIPFKGYKALSLPKNILNGRKIKRGDVIVFNRSNYRGYITEVHINGKEICKLNIEIMRVGAEKVEEDEEGYTFFAKFDSHSGYTSLDKRLCGNKRPGIGDLIEVFYTTGTRAYENVWVVHFNGETAYEKFKN